MSVLDFGEWVIFNSWLWKVQSRIFLVLTNIKSSARVGNLYIIIALFFIWSQHFLNSARMVIPINKCSSSSPTRYFKMLLLFYGGVPLEPTQQLTLWLQGRLAESGIRVKNCMKNIGWFPLPTERSATQLVWIKIPIWLGVRGFFSTTRWKTIRSSCKL